MPYSPYQPFGDDELNTLQGLIATPDASSVPPAGYPNPTPPLGMGGEPPMPAPPVAAPAPLPAPPPVPAAPPVAPLDLSLPQAPTPPKGLVRSEVGYTGVPDAERDKLMGLHQQLMDQQLGATDRAVNTEADIAQRNIATGDKQIGDANVKKNTAEMALAGQASAKAKLQAEGDEWSKMKADPSKAFAGMEWAGVLAAIGIGAGTFAQAMGTQRGNPVQEAFDTHIERSIAAQKEQKNSRLNQIAARVGDIKDAEGILRAQLHDAIADRLTAEQQRSKDQDAMQRLGGLADQQRLAAQKDLVGAYEGMVPREEQKYAPPKPAAAGKDPLTRMNELITLDKGLEERGAGLDNPIRQKIHAELQGISGQSAPQKTDAEQAAKVAADAKKAEAESKKYTAEEAKALAAKDAIDRLAKRANLVPTGDPQNPYTEGPGMVSAATGELLKEGLKEGATAGLYKSPLRADFDAAAEAYGRSQSGGQIGEQEAIGDEKRAGFIRELGGEALGGKQLAERINASLNSIDARLPPAFRGPRSGSAQAPSREDAGFRSQSQGGDPFETKLSADEEANFKVWKGKYAPNDSGSDYDLRGAFKAGLRPSAKNGHWPDTFKKPNHETFSVESKYAKDAPDKAGHWEGDTYVTPDGRRIEGK